jgi:hypothetical protein
MARKSGAQGEKRAALEGFCEWSRVGSSDLSLSSFSFLFLWIVAVTRLA